MKRIPKFVAGAVLAMAVGAVDLPAQDEKAWTMTFSNTFVNKYIWRGQNLANTASMQPGMAVTYKGLTVSSWSQFAHTALGDSGVAGGHWTEHDFTVDYAIPVSEKITANVGWINYAFPHVTAGRYTNEIYGKVSVNTLLKPTVAVYGDIHSADGVYYNFGIGHGINLPKGVALNLSASLGINQQQWIDVTTVSDVILGASLALPVSDKVTLSPFWNYITGNDTLRKQGNSGITFFTGHLGGVALNIVY
jgi:hypothetical protein